MVDVSGDQIMSQRIRGHRLTHHNLPFQANTLHSIDSKHILVNQYRYTCDIKLGTTFSVNLDIGLGQGPIKIERDTWRDGGCIWRSQNE